MNEILVSIYPSASQNTAFSYSLDTPGLSLRNIKISLSRKIGKPCPGRRSGYFRVSNTICLLYFMQAFAIARGAGSQFMGAMPGALKKTHRLILAVPAAGWPGKIRLICCMKQPFLITCQATSHKFSWGLPACQRPPQRHVKAG